MLKNLGVWVGLVLLLFGSAMFAMSLSLRYYGQYGPGPGLFPLWLSGVIIVLALLNIGHAAKDNGLVFKNTLPEKRVVLRILSILGAIVLFIVIAPYVGFLAVSVITLFILLRPAYSWYSSIGISAVVTAVLFVLFDVMLNVPLPTNAWGW